LLYFLRHLFALVVLPVTVTVVVPVWIARTDASALGWPSTLAGVVVASLGVIVLAIGLTLFIASVRRFVSEGRGTLAPWDPPRHLVMQGPYQYVRNPMISGVIFILFGTALVLRSRPHAVWATVFLAVNAVYIPILEEPLLERRFGDAYREYCRHVRRFVPRLRPRRADERQPPD
jgi:protein-S-isoprenylcysteine O-methyltransferase Ste14